MTDYDNSNRLALWLNTTREKQTQPHLTGHGETSAPMWASAWFANDIDPADAKTLMGIIKRHNQSSDKPFLSISLKAKDSAPQAAPQAQSMPDDGFDSEPPF